MDHQDVNMASSRSEPSQSPPSSPQPTIPTAPPPPPPLALLPPPPLAPDESSDNNVLPSYSGTLESFLRSSARQKKWALVLILPRAVSFSVPSSPSPPTSAPSPAPASLPTRPAWGPTAFHQPSKLFAPKHITNNVTLWRRTVTSTDADRYQAFFPTDGHPHIALLDPRSGERLAVWGNVDGQNMIAPTRVHDDFWSNVLDELDEFLKAHSLDEDSLGPAHFRDKTWAVRTRRVSESPTPASLPPTSIMDDEDAAVAAAIAASLAEVQKAEEEDASVEDNFQGSSDEQDDLYSTDSLTQDDDSSAGASTQDDEISVRAGSEQLNESQEAEGMDISRNEEEVREGASRPIAIPSRGRDPTPSSIESVSLSYIDRMESCFRSSTDPALIESRRLRSEQDAELAASLEEDRRRAQEEREEASRIALERQQQKDAQKRLGEEPNENEKGVMTIALRLPGGVRVSRRFNNLDKLEKVGDFAIVSVGCVGIFEKAPGSVLRVPGGRMDAGSWDVELGTLGVGKRAMFVVHVD